MPALEEFAALLKRNRAGQGGVVMSHSTDYQSLLGLRRLAEDHFMSLKVGPRLTYALREGRSLLALMERELEPSTPSRIRDTLLHVMREDPGTGARTTRASPARSSSSSPSDRAPPPPLSRLL